MIAVAGTDGIARRFMGIGGETLSNHLLTISSRPSGSDMRFVLRASSGASYFLPSKLNEIVCGLSFVVVICSP